MTTTGQFLVWLAAAAGNGAGLALLVLLGGSGIPLGVAACITLATTAVAVMQLFKSVQQQRTSK